MPRTYYPISEFREVQLLSQFFSNYVSEVQTIVGMGGLAVNA